ALPLFEPLGLDGFARFVVGGHEIRQGGFRQTVRELQERSNVFEHDLAEACAPDLERWEANVRPGTVLAAGPTIARLADRPERHRDETPRAAIERVQADLRHFRQAQRLDQVVVVNVSSTEPPFDLTELHGSLERLAPALERRPALQPPLPAS